MRMAMKKTLCALTALLAAFLWAPSFGEEVKGASWGGGNYMALCYHDVPSRLENEDKYAVDVVSFIRQIEFMRDYGCHFVSVDDLAAAASGAKPLPDKAVVLTFDDAYESFYKNVFPVLERYKCPAVLAVVSKWLDSPPDEREYIKKDGFMSWEQIAEVSKSGLVEIAAHSFDGHHAVRSNPQGNSAPAMIARAYDPESKTYESEERYRQRVSADFVNSSKAIEKATGKPARVYVWPYGRYTGIGIEEAKKAGYSFLFTLDDGLADLAKGSSAIPRHMVTSNPSIGDFAESFKYFFLPRSQPQLRILQTDLDLICDKDQAQQERNLDEFLERMVKINPSCVYLQAFSDDKADGDIESVYFPNRVLPMKADLLNRVCRCLAIRGIGVYAWMPTLSIKLPDPAENARLRVMERRDGKTQTPTTWYKNRLSPFSKEAVEKLETLYEDMAASAIIDGVIFQDDGFLNDFEDFSPDALAEYVKIAGPDAPDFDELSPDQKKRWTRLKTDKIIELTGKLKASVAKYRPTALYARTIYAPVLDDPKSQEWFAQDFEKCLKSYDFTVVMCYPKMEGVFFAERWLKSLVRKAKDYPGALPKTVFKVQSFDWKTGKWIDSKKVVRWLRVLEAEGAVNVAYYPDDFTVDKPEADAVKPVISARNFPFR